MISEIYEVERKFTVSVSDLRKTPWNYEQIVYQWFTCVGDSLCKKYKLIFDLTMIQVKFVSVKKERVNLGESKKTIEYYDISDFSGSDYLQVPYVAKRRYIYGSLFLDRFIESNGLVDYMMEIEGGTDDNTCISGISILDEVTNHKEYYNENMTTTFTEKALEKLNYLLQVFI